MSDQSDEKTRVTTVVQPLAGPGSGTNGGPRTDCMVVIYTKEPALLGKRFVLDSTIVRIGRGAENAIVTLF